MQIPEHQREAIASLHPELAKAATAVYTEPRVHEAIRTLGEFGLAVFLPHKHNEQDKMVPLPQGEVQSEENLKVSFIAQGESSPDAVIVGWRMGPNGEVDPSAECSSICYCKGSHK